jgi:ribose 5-phosphate isomerase A
VSLDSSDARVSVGATADPDELARQKRAAADCAVEHVRSGMVVGLGAGSTALFAIARIAERIAERRLVDVTGVPCSRDAGEAAARLGIQIGTLNDYPAIDLTIDGADEVDPDLDLIKGAGGALLHEKMVEQASRRVMIVVDASKPSPVLGSRRAVPVVVVAFGWRAQLRYIESLGARVQLRLDAAKSPYLTDDGHRILDCTFGHIGQPADLAALLRARAGIVEHGLFLGIATDLIIGLPDGVRHLVRDGDRTGKTQVGPQEKRHETV